MDELAHIIGKTTPFSFTIQLHSSINRHAFLAAKYDGSTYVLNILQLWNENEGMFAKVAVIGETPSSPFPLDTKIFEATEEEILKSLGLHLDPRVALNLGKISSTELQSNLNVEKLGRLFLTGRSGSGKSYTVGVLIEELMRKKVPVVLIDRHGEFSTLKLLNPETVPKDDPFFNPETKEYLQGIIEFANLETNPSADLGLEYLIASDFKDLIQQGRIIIINLRGEDLAIQENIIEQVASKLYKDSTLGKIPPHFLFIDEAHLFAGKKKKPVQEVLRLLAQEGRKFGANLIVSTQKPQALDTTIRAQAGTWIIHKLTDINDVKITVNSAEGLHNDAEDEIQNLGRGEAIISGDLTPFCPIQVQVRLRYTIHGGNDKSVLNPSINQQQIPKSDLVEKIRNLIPIENAKSMSSEVLSSDKLSVAELYTQIDKLKRENLELKQQIQDLMKKTESLKDPVETIDNISKALASNPKSQQLSFEEQMALLEKENDDLQFQLLEMSGAQVELQDLKDKFSKEQKRADDAVELAEKLLIKIKKSKK